MSQVQPMSEDAFERRFIRDRGYELPRTTIIGNGPYRDGVSGRGEAKKRALQLEV